VEKQLAHHQRAGRGREHPSRIFGRVVLRLGQVSASATVTPSTDISLKIGRAIGRTRAALPSMIADVEQEHRPDSGDGGRGRI